MTLGFSVLDSADGSPGDIANAVVKSFKQKKIDLVKDGFDPGQTIDPIYFSDPQRKAFVRLDAALFDQINAGQIRL